MIIAIRSIRATTGSQPLHLESRSRQGLLGGAAFAARTRTAADNAKAAESDHVDREGDSSPEQGRPFHSATREPEPGGQHEGRDRKGSRGDEYTLDDPSLPKSSSQRAAPCCPSRDGTTDSALRSRFDLEHGAVLHVSGHIHDSGQLRTPESSHEQVSGEGEAPAPTRTPRCRIFPSVRGR